MLAVKALLIGDFLTQARAAGVTVVSLARSVSWSRLQRLASTLLAAHPAHEHRTRLRAEDATSVCSQ